MYAASHDGEVTTTAASDEATLKATAPQPVEPVGDAETAGLQVTLVTRNAAAPHLDGNVPFAYRFEVYEDGGTTPLHGGRVDQDPGAGPDGETSYPHVPELVNDRRYRWRVRAEYGGHAGPWSEDAFFRTPPASIEAPAPIRPGNGDVDVWQVVLEATNGETSGDVGRVTLTFEVSEAAFAGDGCPGGALCREEPAGAGTTSIRLSSNDLEPETLYHWRVIARDDRSPQTASDYSETFRFTTPALEFGDPTPADGATNAARRPNLSVRTRGAVVGVTMTFQVATDAAFGSIVATHEAAAGAGSTGFALSDDLEAETTYHWRVIARHDGAEHATSSSFEFTTARAAGGGGGGSAGDEIDPSQVRWLHTNPTNWSVTSTITDVRIRDVKAGGICVEHTRAGRWPVVNINGTPLEGNPWVFAEIGGRWYAGTYEWNRPGQTCKLTVAGKHGTPTDELGPHIKVAPMTNWKPRSGDRVGFMVSTPARYGADGPRRERSNIVIVTWP